MRVWLLCLSLIFALIGLAPASADVRVDVKALFAQDMNKIDFAETMVAVERIINPDLDGDTMLAEIDRMDSAIQTAVPHDALDQWVNK